MPIGTLLHGALYNSFTKRIFDIGIAVLLLIFFSPIMLLVACAIKLSSPGPIFADTPERVGTNGKKFRMYKFRSMIRHAHRILREDPKFKKLYEEYKKSSYKLHDDPRITSIGRFIRKHSLDEMPQLINVLKGEMSIVGPRAYYPDEIKEQLKKHPEAHQFLVEVLQVRPGITGYWQVSGRSEVHFRNRIIMDASYVKKISLWYDIQIIVLTPWTMISGRGAV